VTDVSDLGSGRKKRAHAKEVREKSILTLYNKLHELVSLLAELLNIQVLTDTAVLHASSMGVAPFFVESVSELQLSALKLVTTVSYMWHLKIDTLYCSRFFFLANIEFC
jgi:cohesin loading factor subunit SCC2